MIMTLCKHPLMILASVDLYFDGCRMLISNSTISNQQAVVWKKHSFVYYQYEPTYFVFYSMDYKSITAFTYFDVQIIPRLSSESLSTLAPVFLTYIIFYEYCISFLFGTTRSSSSSYIFPVSVLESLRSPGSFQWGVQFASEFSV